MFLIVPTKPEAAFNHRSSHGPGPVARCWDAPVGQTRAIRATLELGRDPASHDQTDWQWGGVPQGRARSYGQRSGVGGGQAKPPGVAYLCKGGRRGEAGEGGIRACFPRRQSVHEKFLSREISLLRAGAELAADRCPVSCRFSTLGGKVAVFSLPRLFLWPLGRGSGPERGLPKASRALGRRGLTSCRSFTALVQVDFVLFYFLNLKNVYLLSHITNHWKEQLNLLSPQENTAPRRACRVLCRTSTSGPGEELLVWVP